MTVLSIQNLSKEYPVSLGRGKVTALKDLNLTVKAGEIFGFLGPNGAGKTTTLKILMGLIMPTRGSAEILGYPIGHKALHRLVGFLPENPYLYPFLSGEEFMDFCGRLRKIPNPKRKQTSKELLHKVGLEAAAKGRIGNYSKGMLQRLGLAQALLSDPELLFLDEPLSGLDPIGRREISELIIELQKQGKTIFFCSHILPDVENLCHRVAILHQGKLLREGKIEDLVGFTRKSIQVRLRHISEVLQAKVITFAQSYEITGEIIDLYVASEKEVQQIIALIPGTEAEILSITPQQESLEDYFVRETKQEK